MKQVAVKGLGRGFAWTVVGMTGVIVGCCCSTSLQSITFPLTLNLEGFILTRAGKVF